MASFTKKEWRDRIWRVLEESGVTLPPKPVYNRIPNFRGADNAAKRVLATKEWSEARIVKINPDSPQKPIRLHALWDNKILLMPTPRIKKGFLLLDPAGIPSSKYSFAATIKGAFQYGRLIGLGELEALDGIDLVIEGSVVVNKWGERLGKGEGYGELEYAILRELGLVDEHTPIYTTVHDLQVVDEKLPQDPWDVPVDKIFTPTRVIHVTDRGPRPPGILWRHLSREKLFEIPLLQELAYKKGVDQQ